MSEPNVSSIDDPSEVDKIFGLENPKGVFCLYGSSWDEENFTSRWDKHDPDFQSFMAEDFETASSVFEEIVEGMKEEWDELKQETHTFRGETYYEANNCASGVALFETSDGRGLVVSSKFNPSVYAPIFLVDDIRDKGIVGTATHCKYERLPEEIRGVLRDMGLDVPEVEDDQSESTSRIFGDGEEPDFDPEEQWNKIKDQMEKEYDKDTKFPDWDDMIKHINS